MVFGRQFYSGLFQNPEFDYGSRIPGLFENFSICERTFEKDGTNLKSMYFVSVMEEYDTNLHDFLSTQAGRLSIRRYIFKQICIT